MPRFNPDELLKGEDVYIIGGGASVLEYDLTPLKQWPVIGLNQGFIPLKDYLDFCVFGDTSFMNFIGKHYDEFLEFHGKTITNCSPPIGSDDVEDIYFMERSSFMEKGKTLGWYGNTGVLAIEVAITLGADRIFLLGYDNYNNENGISHYHKYHRKPTSNRVYQIFNQQFERANKVWKEDYPNVEIINLNLKSGYDQFKKIDGHKHLRSLRGEDG